ncbi:hypothetical protein QUF55_08105 [Clostridiaceae bacterium HSG29]|nr:hypothetical protein [Clostridiaceae bacterium HSG29]
MNIKKGYLFLVIGILLVLFCSRNLLIESNIFDTSATILEYEILNDIDNNELQAEISENTGQKLDEILIKQKNNRLRIEFDLIDNEKLENLERNIDELYKEDIQIISSHLIGTEKLNMNFYMIIALLAIFLIIGVTMIWKGLVMLKAEKRDMK